MEKHHKQDTLISVWMFLSFKSGCCFTVNNLDVCVNTQLSAGQCARQLAVRRPTIASRHGKPDNNNKQQVQIQSKQTKFRNYSYSIYRKQKHKNMRAQNMHAHTTNDSTGLVRATNDNMMHIKYATTDNLQPMAIRQKLKVCAQITVILNLCM